MPRSDNFQSTIPLLAPTGGVIAGTLYRVGNALALAMTTVAAGVFFSAKVTGIVRAAPKLGATGQAVAAGAIVYWDNTNKRFTVNTTGMKNHGVTVVTPATAAATTVDVLLAGIPAV